MNQICLQFEILMVILCHLYPTVQFKQVSKLSNVRHIHKWPLKKTNIGFADRLSLNAGQKGAHSAILLIFNKLRFVIKIFGLSIFEQQLKARFTGCILQSLSNKTRMVSVQVYYTYVYCSYFLTFCLHHQLYNLQCSSNKNQICFH